MSEKQTKPAAGKGGRLKRVLAVILWLCILGLACYGGLIAWVYHQEVSVPKPAEYDSIIVLGAQVLPNGEPSVQLRWRLDQAKEAYEAIPCDIVVTGGQGGQEPRPEGDVMRELLISEGIDSARVISDPFSADTKENIANAWEILKERGCTRPLVITSDYHLPRALAIMGDLGLEPQGLGSLCRPELSFWLKNHMREALAWVKYWGIKYLGLSL
ncbi:MAG: ElyC/SanA/YdcF family protein [Eubacteriales bacterium]|nr:ElyC/SanA/YdcF family protein [Eubacteriales bacterium]